MTIARAHLIDPSMTRWYHCVTRRVRRAYLLGDQKHNRKEWIESRLKSSPVALRWPSVASR
jgi:hypothetical protein